MKDMEIYIQVEAVILIELEKQIIEIDKEIEKKRYNIIITMNQEMIHHIDHKEIAILIVVQMIVE